MEKTWYFFERVNDRSTSITFYIIKKQSSIPVRYFSTAGTFHLRRLKVRRDLHYLRRPLPSHGVVHQRGRRGSSENHDAVGRGELRVPSPVSISFIVIAVAVVVFFARNQKDLN